MNVFLLGAGASKAYSNPNLNISMPMAKDFFQTFNKLDIASNQYVLVGDLIRYVEENYNVTPEDFGNYTEDIEVIHSEIHEKLINVLKEYQKDYAPSGIEYLNFKPHQQLLFLFNSVINEIQNGVISESHRKLVNCIAEDDAIITFNWDTLIDRALDEKMNWNCGTGYYVKPEAVYNDRWVDTLTDKASSPLLLKLHGSTNWLTGYFNIKEGKLRPDQIMPYDTFFVYKHSTKTYPTYRGRYFPGYQPFSYGYYPVNIPGESQPFPDGYYKFRTKLNYDPRVIDKINADESGLVSMPVIIPPVKHKEYDMFGSLFNQLWEKAEEQIAIAEKIYILGYSFPVTDIKANDLFIRAFSKRKTMPYVYIINPYPEQIKNKFNLDFGIDDDHLVVIKEYFSSTFDFNIFR